MCQTDSQTIYGTSLVHHTGSPGQSTSITRTVLSIPYKVNPPPTSYVYTMGWYSHSTPKDQLSYAGHPQEEGTNMNLTRRRVDIDDHREYQLPLGSTL